MHLTFSATDENNRIVTTLVSSDVAVVDNDSIVRNFRSFSRAEYARLDVAILLDNSGSIGSRFQQEIAQTINLISQTSGIPESNVSIVSFRGTQPIVLCQRDCRDWHGAELVSASSSDGMTPLFDSLAFASEMLSQTQYPNRRRVVIVLSDGDDTISRSSLGEAVSALIANDIHVYALDANSSSSAQGSILLRQLAAATGGQAFRLCDGAAAAADAVLADFRASYQITYQVPDSNPGFHSLRILPTHNLNLTFRGRQGYFNPASR